MQLLFGPVFVQNAVIIISGGGLFVCTFSLYARAFIHFNEIIFMALTSLFRIDLDYFCINVAMHAALNAV